MNDSSFDVPLFGGISGHNITVNVIEAVHSSHCLVCNRPLGGAVACLGAPYSAIVHSQCVQNVRYTEGWPHRFPVGVYREMSLAVMARGASGGPQQANLLK